MSLETDNIVDRRRLRRKLTFWRAAAVLIAIAGITGAAFMARRADTSLVQPLSPQISRVTISGLIMGDHERTEALDRLAKSTATKAVIIHVDSPGGTTTGSEELHQALRRVAAQKPTVVVVDGMAASGGYMAAMAGDHIIAQNSSLVGSIGVLFQYPNFSDLMSKVGVSYETIKSSPLKASPNGLEPTTPEARAAIEALVSDSYAWFKDMVKDRRKLDGGDLDKVVDGRVFTGRQAITLKLADEIGREQEAIDWLAKTKDVDPKLPVRDWRLHPRLSQFSILHLAASRVLDGLGLGSLARGLEMTGTLQAAEKLNLDGLLMVWHPSIGN
jgi:protease IV